MADKNMKFSHFCYNTREKTPTKFFLSINMGVLIAFQHVHTLYTWIIRFIEPVNWISSSSTIIWSFLVSFSVCFESYFFILLFSFIHHTNRSFFHFFCHRLRISKFIMFDTDSFISFYMASLLLFHSFLLRTHICMCVVYSTYKKNKK